jgi:cobalamin synthase
MTDSGSDDQKYYRYDPSLAAAIIFIVLLVFTSSFHFYQMVRTRTWYFIPFVVGACCKSCRVLIGIYSNLPQVEWIGYIGRAISSQESPNWTLGPYLIQTLFILLGPALFAASIYMELGHIILLTHGEKHSIIKKRWLTKFFVLGDVISFFTQASGKPPNVSVDPS